jgi:predicted kinase
MLRPTLLVMVGLPRSGKSTWAKAAALLHGYPVVCPDQIRLALHGERYSAVAEPFVWAIAKVMVRSLFGSGHPGVILDATNTSRKRRDEWRDPDWDLRFKLVETSYVECLARAGTDAELLPVIERMAKEFDPLGDDELRWAF